MTNQGRRGAVPTAAAGTLLFLVIVGTNIGLALAAEALSLPTDVTLFVTQALLVALTVGAVLGLGVDARETLLLRWPTPADILMAIPLALSFVVLGDQLGNLTLGWFEIPDAIMESLRETLRASSPLGWFVKLGVIGVGPSVSEELAFRGFLLAAFVPRIGASWAVVTTAILFTLIHGLPLPTFALAGIVLGITALATRSIAVPMLIHFINNASALALLNLAGLETLGAPVWIPTSILVPAAGIFVLTMGYYFVRLVPDEPPEPEPWAKPQEPPLPSLDLGRSSRTLREELAETAAWRRRLGWALVGLATAAGTLVLLGLFVLSVYVVRPQQFQGALIESMRESERLESVVAAGKSTELTEALDLLATANDEGRLHIEHLALVLQSYFELHADGRFDGDDADELIATIYQVVRDATVPRRL